MHNFILFDFKSYTKLEIKVTKTRERERVPERGRRLRRCSSIGELVQSRAPKFLLYFKARIEMGWVCGMPGNGYGEVSVGNKL
jgi:hypothetical protein